MNACAAGLAGAIIGRQRSETHVSADEIRLDLRGLRCPEPVLRAKTALAGVAVGGVLVLECTDPLTEIDVPHFARQTGHDLARQERRDALYLFWIVKTHDLTPSERRRKSP